MGRSAGCRSGTGAVVGPASPADAGVVAAAFLRPRPPDAAGCPARETALRPAAGWGSPASGTAASASAACRTAKDPSTGGAICATASATGTGPSSATGAAFGLPARRRRAVVFFGGVSGPGGTVAAAVSGGIFLWDGVRRFPGSPVRRRSLFPPAVPLAGRRRACRLPFLKAIRRCLFGRRFSLRRLFPLPGRLFRARRRRLKTTGLQQREGRGCDDGHPLARQPSFCLLPGSGRPVGGSIGRRGHGTP